MQTNITPVSFCGDITITRWKRGVAKLATYNSTRKQDMLLRSYVKKYAPSNAMVMLDEKKANGFQLVLEQIAGVRLQKIKGEKSIYSSPNSIRFEVPQAKKLDGFAVDVDFS